MDQGNITRVSVAFPAQLDALVGWNVLGESPEIYWEDSYSLFQFGSEKEAADAIRDPYYQLFLPEADWSSAGVRKVQVFKPYSSDPKAAWDIIEHIAKEKELSLKNIEGMWAASFGDHPQVSAKTAAVAICLAALRACGIEVEQTSDFPG